MLWASRLRDTHALAVQTLPAEPAAAGPLLQPVRHDAASATTPSAATGIRLATTNLPAAPAVWQTAKPVPSVARGRSGSTRHSAVGGEWPRLRYLPKPSR